MIDVDTHIALLRYDKVPDGLLNDFCTSVNANSLRFENISQPEPGPQASIEYLALPAIAVFLLKPYFKSFMKEAGKDHYHVLKRALKALGKKLFSEKQELRVVILTASGEKKLEYSLLFAIYATIDDGSSAKLLFREGCSEDEFCESIEEFLKFVESCHYEDAEYKSSITLDLNKRNGDLTLVAYDRKSKSLQEVNLKLDRQGGKSSDV